jgi:RimJ/RimL family protein N-acetyltransferase
MANGPDTSSSRSVWAGRLVRLRAIEPSDWETFQRFDTASEMARRAYWIPFPRSTEGYRRWAEREATREPDGDAFRFAIETLACELVGTMNTVDCDRRNGTFSYGIALGREHWRKGYASEAIVLALRYYFGELRYQKVTVRIYAFNDASIRLHERLGFQPEGRRRRMFYTGGQYHDECLYGMTAEEFDQVHGRS